MTCYHPRPAWRSLEGRNPKTGAWPITFDPYKGVCLDTNKPALLIPCGKCIGCRLEQSRQWAVRCSHEATLHEKNSFLTLTYDNFNLDPSGSLNKTDIQLFFKRLRKYLEEYDIKIRYFQCGEYGELHQRPHHHVILFGYDFPGRNLYSMSNGFPLYTSKTLSDLWPFGMHTIGDVTFESSAYVARYVLKKIEHEGSDKHDDGRLKEYTTMSRRPGIGNAWIKKYANDVYPHDYVVIRNGIKCRPPAYYDKIFDSIQDKYNINQIKLNRKNYAMSKKYDNTVDRLQVKETIQLLKMDKLPRPLE